jgi:catechol 2,3-dioxygenase-like lactoylglutathione lyase family enzyme
MNSIGSQGFHHIAVATRDFERSAAFYRDGLGFGQVMTWGDRGNRAAMFDAGNSGRIELFERPEHKLQQGQLLHLALRVADCRKAHAVALAAGAREVKPPQEVDIPSDPVCPVTISFVAGPDGEEIEFFQER